MKASAMLTCVCVWYVCVCVLTVRGVLGGVGGVDRAVVGADARLRVPRVVARRPRDALQHAAQTSNADVKR